MDNITAPGAGIVFATDDIGDVHYPRTKISFGADGSAADVSSSNPLPVTFGANPLNVDFPETQAVVGPLTNAQLRQEPVEVSGDISIVGTVPVSGPITDQQLRAVPVDVNVEGTVPVSAQALPLPTGAATSALQTAGNNAIAALRGTEYETVAASQTDQVLGAVGAVGDFLESLLIVPSSLSPGAISIQDGTAGVDITVFAGGPDSVSTLHPFSVVLGIRALSTGWRVTTGAAVSVVASGNFT